MNAAGPDRDGVRTGDRAWLSPAEVRRWFRVEVPGAVPDGTEVHEVVDLGDHRRELISYRTTDGDRVPAYLFVPQPAPDRGPGVVVFHQHASQWHLGKSEVAGLAGAPLQAFGPALAARGITVLAPDAICFEDRRRQTGGLDPHPDDLRQHENEHAYRLVVGDTLARKALQDALAACSVLASRPEVGDHLGAIGHSYGGQTALLLGAVDDRVRFVCASGTVGSMRAKMAADVGIERALIVPGIAEVLDLDTFIACLAPRPLLVVAGVDDKHALDAADVVATAAPAYADRDATDALACHVLPGGHELTGQRHDLIIDWTVVHALGSG